MLHVAFQFFNLLNDSVQSIGLNLAATTALNNFLDRSKKEITTENDFHGNTVVFTSLFLLFLEPDNTYN